jgi:hypothetical protein
MSKFVIRSMSTTNLPECRPYHIYLKPVAKRAGAYWASIYDAERFDSFEAAVEAARSKIDGFDIVPEDHKDLPTYWEARREKARAS